MLHEGYLLGTQQLISATETPLKLHCGVLRDQAESQTETQQLAAGEERQLQADIGRQISGQQQDSVASKDSRTVTCQISGGFHPYAGPPPTPLQPLKIPLTAHVIQPHLEPEFLDAADSLSFRCHATHDPATHPSFTQAMLLINMHSCALRFSLSTQASPSFQIVKATPSAVSKLAGLRTVSLCRGVQSIHGLNTAAKGLLDDSIVLQPHEHVTVLMRYTPQLSWPPEASATGNAQQAVTDDTAEAQSAQGSGVIQDESAQGSLLITYQNGQLQQIPMQGQCLHPNVRAVVSSLHFGAVHLHSPKVLQIEVSNPSMVDATWCAQVEGCSRLGDSSNAASVSFAARAALSTANGGKATNAVHTMQPNGQASSVFTCCPSVGTLIGRGLGMPKKLQLSVKFAPVQLGAYSAVLVIQVAQGSTVRIGLSGEGSLTEADEVQARLKGI